MFSFGSKRKIGSYQLQVQPEQEKKQITKGVTVLPTAVLRSASLLLCLRCLWAVMDLLIYMLGFCWIINTQSNHLPQDE